jgi:hypothetical protein
MIFVDGKGRVFSLGSNKSGKTGLGLTVINEKWHSNLLEMDSQDYRADELKERCL